MSIRRSRKTVDSPGTGAVLSTTASPASRCVRPSPTVMVGETVLALPSAWVHPSQGLTGLWCFIPPTTTGEQPWAYVDSQGRTRAIPPPTPTRDNTRCAFFVSTN